MRRKRGRLLHRVIPGFLALLAVVIPAAPAAAQDPGAVETDGLPGRWRLDPGRVPTTPAQREAAERLRSIGYLGGSEPAPARAGVVRHDPARAFRGWNVSISGHAPEAVLMDMDGEILHRWSFPFREAFPGYPVPAGSNAPDYWRRVHVLENGDLLAIHEGLGLIRLDRDSRLIWSNPLGAHHDLHVDAKGFIYVLTRRPAILPRIHPDEVVLEDFVTVLDSGGRVYRSISLLEVFERSPFRTVLDDMKPGGDLFHTNTLHVFDGSRTDLSPLYKRGNALISILNLDLIAIVDLAAEEAVWVMEGGWHAQHQPELLESGNLLLFDNRGGGAMSRVLELSPDGEVVWSYEGTPENGFYTYDCGSSARLPGGNTLITQSNAGRAFEVTPGGEIVWEFINPERAGANGELVATLFEMLRLPPDFPLDWMNR